MDTKGRKKSNGTVYFLDMTNISPLVLIYQIYTIYNNAL